MAPRKTALKETTANRRKTAPKDAKTEAGVKKPAQKKSKAPLMCMTAKEARNGGSKLPDEEPAPPKPKAKKHQAKKTTEPLMNMSAAEARNGIPVTDVLDGTLPTPKTMGKVKSTSTPDALKSNELEESVNSPSELEDPYEYVLVPRPLWDCEDANPPAQLMEPGKIYTGAQLRELAAKIPPEPSAIEIYETGAAEFCGEGKQSIPASEQPDHPWVMTKKSIADFDEALCLTYYRDPARFGIYIYNDFYGYGQIEMVENMIATYNKLSRKKDTDIKDLWMHMASFGMFLSDPELEVLQTVDDGQQYFELMDLAGLAFLSALNDLDNAGELGPESQFKDLGFVMGAFVSALATTDAGGSQEFLKFVARYAIDKKITVVAHRLKKLMEEHKGPVGMPARSGDKWGFRKKLKAYKSKHGKFGGHHFDITKLSAAESMIIAYDRTDPLAGMPKGFVYRL